MLVSLNKHNYFVTLLFLLVGNQDKQYYKINKIHTFKQFNIEQNMYSCYTSCYVFRYTELSIVKLIFSTLLFIWYLLT